MKIDETPKESNANNNMNLLHQYTTPSWSQKNKEETKRKKEFPLPSSMKSRKQQAKPPKQAWKQFIFSFFIPLGIKWISHTDNNFIPYKPSMLAEIRHSGWTNTTHQMKPKAMNFLSIMKHSQQNKLSNETKTPHTYSQNNSKAPKFLKDMVISWFFI